MWETILQSENIQEGRGSGRCYTELQPRFCLGPAYVLSHYLVQAFVGVFHTRRPLKLEDVYMGLLAKRFRVTPRRHRGFITDSLNGRFFFRSSLITLSLKCIVIVLFNALQQRFREIVHPENTITNMKQHISRLAKGA